MECVEKNVASKRRDENKECWRKIPDIPYELSNLGRVRRCCKYKGKARCDHYTYPKCPRNTLEYKRKLFNIPKLVLELWGDSFVDDLNGELWKDIVGYEDFYQISNFGRVKSKGRYILCKNGKQFFKHPQIIKPTLVNSGYKTINLHGKNGKLYTRLVHRLVAEHFIPNPNEWEQVNHKDENKHNNQVSNLEWCTQEYNSLYGTNQERRIATRLKNNGGKYGVHRNNNGIANF